MAQSSLVGRTSVRKKGYEFFVESNKLIDEIDGKAIHALETKVVLEKIPKKGRSLAEIKAEQEKIVVCDKRKDITGLSDLDIATFHLAKVGEVKKDINHYISMIPEAVKEYL